MTVSGWGTEARVGVFVVAALVAFVAFMVVLGDCSLSSGVRVYADFAYTGGLQVGAPVKISGVRIGRVVDLALLTANISPPAAVGAGIGRNRPPVVRVAMEIDEHYRRQIGREALVQVETQGIIGQSYLEVAPVAGATEPEFGAVRGVDAPQLQTMLLQASSLLQLVSDIAAQGTDTGGGLASALTELLRTSNGILGGRRQAIEASIDNIEAMTADFRRLARRLAQVGDDPVVVQGVHDAGALASSLRRGVPELIGSAGAALTQVRALTGRLNDLATDSESDIEAVLAEMSRASVSLRQAAARVDRLLSEVERGEGTLGGFVKDPQIYDDLKFIFRDLKRNPWKLFWRE